ncbi:MAG: nucleotidyltransferase family protein [Pseudomonadota bacterium]
MDKLKNICVTPHHTLHETMKRVDVNLKGIALVVDDENRLLYTITDGDLRRVVLHDLPMHMTVEDWARQRSESGNRQPFTASVGTPAVELLRLMTEHDVRHIPLTDADGRVVDLVILSDLVSDYTLPLNAVVMAGGAGKRLYPLTKDICKPMLPMGDRPLLELIIMQLKKTGIRRVNLATRHMRDQIVDHFGDGDDFGIKIQYVEEDRPLGTAGALGLIKEHEEPLLVINGDVLTGLDFRSMCDFHHDHKADMTIAVKQHEVCVPYGVVHTEGAKVTGLSEKPVIRNFINAGIYLIGPQLCRQIPGDQHYDMTDLIKNAVESGRRVISFPIREYWMDIGQIENYEKAISDVKNGMI